MEEGRRNGSLFRKKQWTQLPTLICIILVIVYGGTLTLAAAQSDGHDSKIEITNSAVTEETTPATPPEKTSNAIPEAEQGTLEISKKYNSKKSETEGRQPVQLERLYPYPYKSQSQSEISKTASALGSDQLDNSIQQQSNQSNTLTDLGSLNGTPVFSISEPNTIATTESISTTDTSVTSGTSTLATSSASTTDTSTTSDSIGTTTYTTDDTTDTTDTTYISDTTTDISSISTLDHLSDTTTTTVEDEFSTAPATSATQNTQQTTNLSSSSVYTEKEASTTQNTQQSTTFSLSSENSPTTVDQLSTNTENSINSVTATTLTAASLTNQQELSTDISDVSSTTTELIMTILQEESSTVTMNEELPRKTTSVEVAAPIPDTSTLMPLTTQKAAVTPVGSTTPKSSISTTTATTATMMVLSPSSTVKSRSMTPVSPETYTTVSTWQDENVESTTDAITPPLPTEDVTVLIRIVIEGTWQDICSKLPILRQSLADLVNSVEKTISPGQIVFHQTQCSDNLTPKSLMSEVPLTSVLVYIVDENGNFDGTLTKILPRLYEMTPIDFPLPIHSVLLVQEADSGNAIAVVIVSCVAFICLILLAGLLFIMRKRQGRFNYGERCRPVSLDAYSLDSVGSAYNSVRRSKAGLRYSKRSYGNPTFEDSSIVPSHPLNFAGLSSFCNDTNGIAEEFAGIPQVSSKIDELPAGAEIKNRYANVIPLPETRVLLQRLNNDPLTEYINASYVRGPKNATKYYIACQAPTDNTVADFWRMIWEQQCKVIIMLTDLVENGVEKCTEYIPPLEVSDCHRLFGDFQVTLRKREAKEKYAISSLHLKNLENNTFREVWHIWYLWPVNGVPSDGAGLIAVLLEARALQRGASGPTVVHCSPGTGRTGTLIALDLAIRQYEITRTVDVPRAVYTIRRDRAGAVQTKEQYAFIYKSLNLYASKLAGGAIEST